MATETHTGRLTFGDGQAAMDDGTVLAVTGSPTPCASAVAAYSKWGETQPVTVTGYTGAVDNQQVLFVTSIGWAAGAAAPLPAVNIEESEPEAKLAFGVAQPTPATTRADADAQDPPTPKKPPTKSARRRKKS